MKLYKERLLSPAQLKRLGEHKYSYSSTSLLDPLLQYWWNWLVQRVPIWLAPNLITILGLLVNIITTLILVWYSPDARQDAPRWACALCAFGLFVYQSLDAIDGKQARRTGTSSPLGELFDHGCDSISTIFVALSACIAVQLGHYPTWMFFQCFCAITLFYCAHWQTYVSGTLRFGKVDVTEAQFTIMAIHIISATFGTSVWQTKFFSDTFSLWYMIPLSTVACTSVSFYQTMTIIFTGGVGKNGSTVAVFGTDYSLTNVASAIFYVGYVQVFVTFLRSFEKGGCGKNGSTVALPALDMELKMLPIGLAALIALLLAQANISVIFTGGVGKNGSTVAGTSVLSPVIPFSLVLVPAYIIYRKSIEHIYEMYPSLYILAFGMVAAKVTNRLVVAHMTKSEMEYMDWSLLGPAMLFLNQYFNTFINEYIVLWMCMIWATFDLMRYSSQICFEICDHLHIDLFRIPYPGGPLPMPARSSHGVKESSAVAAFTATPAEKNGSNHSEFDIEDTAPLL